MYSPEYVEIRKKLILLMHNIIVLKPAELKKNLQELIDIVDRISVSEKVEAKVEEPKVEEPVASAKTEEEAVEVETRSVQEVAKEVEEEKVVEKNKKRKYNQKKGQDE